MNLEPLFVMPTAETRTSLVRWSAVLVPGGLLYFAPLGQLPPGSRHLLAVFVATIFALTARPVPAGVMALLSMTLLVLTSTLPLATALAGFGNATAWLILSAFLFAEAVRQTRLGLRVAYFLIGRLARNSVMLGYAAAASNLALAPLVPSDTARSGVVAPVLHDVARVLGSEPGPTAARIGSYLTLAGFHTNYLASLLFLTSMAGNPLAARFAADAAGVELSWARWVLAACVPGLISFALAPWLLHSLVPPQLQDISHARRFAREKLAVLGPMSRREKILLLILGVVIAGWITSPWHRLDNAAVALAGVCLLLLTGVLPWEDLTGSARAWEVLIVFAPLLMMAGELSRQGVTGALASAGLGHLRGCPWPFSLAVLALGYCYAHYLFPSLTAHVTALYPSFLGAALLLGVPAPLAAWTLAFLSNLNAGLTHYGTGSAPLYFAGGYLSHREWWAVGFVVTLANLAVWLGVGPLWWKWAGLW